MLEFFTIAMQIGVVVVALYAVTASHIVNRRLERERAAATQREKECPITPRLRIAPRAGHLHERTTSKGDSWIRDR